MDTEDPHTHTHQLCLQIDNKKIKERVSQPLELRTGNNTAKDLWDINYENVSRSVVICTNCGLKEIETVPIAKCAKNV